MIILVGCIHRDPLGYRRLLHLLYKLKPDVMCVEISPFSLWFRGMRMKRFIRLYRTALKALPPAQREHHQLLLIREAIKVPYEWRAARSVGRELGIPVHAVDVNWPSRKGLSGFEEIISEDNLRRLIALPDISLEIYIERLYREAMTMLLDPQPFSSRFMAWLGDYVSRRRERVMACRIRKLANFASSLVHICGWVHLISLRGVESLFGLLSHLHPERYLLGLGRLGSE